MRSFADSLQLARDQYMVDMGHGIETIQTGVTRLGQSLAELNKGHKDRLSKQWERHEPELASKKQFLFFICSDPLSMLS